MRSLHRPLITLSQSLAFMSKAMAGDTTIGIETLFERAPNDLDEAKNVKFQGNVAHEFGNAFVLGGSFEPEINKSSVWTYNLEGTLGYGLKLTHGVSLSGSGSGSGGVGERFQPATSGGDFPYYVLRVRADIDLSERWSWNLITYRYRNAFDTANNYDTPEVSTAITLKIDNSSSVYTKYLFNWQNGSPDTQGFGIGYKHRF